MKPLLPAVRASLEAATAAFGAAMPGSPAADYARRRHIDPRCGARFRLGYVPPNFPGWERFGDRLAIPNICASGHVVGLKFRALNDGAEPKYDKPAGLPNRLFNLDALNRASDMIALCEGELDAVILEQLGVPCVGIQGANSWKRHHPSLFEGFDRVVMVTDADDKGRDLAKRVAQSDLPVVVVEPPGGFKDATEAVVAGLGDELLASIKGDRT